MIFRELLPVLNQNLRLSVSNLLFLPINENQGAIHLHCSLVRKLVQHIKFRIFQCKKCSINWCPQWYVNNVKIRSRMFAVTLCSFHPLLYNNYQISNKKYIQRCLQFIIEVHHRNHASQHPIAKLTQWKWMHPHHCV